VDDLGKIRVYNCPYCGKHPVRPLRGDPKPCDVCLTDLSEAEYTISDYSVLYRDLLNRDLENG